MGVGEKTIPFILFYLKTLLPSLPNDWLGPRQDSHTHKQKKSPGALGKYLPYPPFNDDL